MLGGTLFTRPCFLIRQAAFILILSTVSFFMPGPGAEFPCWAQTLSPDQKTDQADTGAGQQAPPPSSVLPPATSQAAPGESGRSPAGPAAGINGAVPGKPSKRAVGDTSETGPTLYRCAPAECRATCSAAITKSNYASRPGTIAPRAAAFSSTRAIHSCPGTPKGPGHFEFR